MEGRKFLPVEYAPLIGLTRRMHKSRKIMAEIIVLFNFRLAELLIEVT